MVQQQFAAKLALLMLVVGFEEANPCELRKPGMDIDWSRFTGSWYLAFHGGDEIMKDVSCYVLSNFVPDVGGCWIDVEEYYYRSPMKKFKTHVIREKSGVYKIDKDVESMISQLHNRSRGFHDRKDKVLTMEMHQYDVQESGSQGYQYESGDVLFLTDYMNYQILLKCSPTGDWILWLKAPTATPSIKVLELGYEVLENVGITRKLYPSQCGKLIGKNQ